MLFTTSRETWLENVGQGLNSDGETQGSSGERFKKAGRTCDSGKPCTSCRHQKKVCEWRYDSDTSVQYFPEGTRPSKYSDLLIDCCYDCTYASRKLFGRDVVGDGCFPCSECRAKAERQRSQTTTCHQPRGDGGVQVHTVSRGSRAARMSTSVAASIDKIATMITGGATLQPWDGGARQGTPNASTGEKAGPDHPSEPRSPELEGQDSASACAVTTEDLKVSPLDSQLIERTDISSLPSDAAWLRRIKVHSKGSSIRFFSTLNGCK